MFTQSPGQYEPPLGDFLWELTSELTCKAVGCKGCNITHKCYIFALGDPNIMHIWRIQDLRR
jgi:hypothetical protein